MTKRRDPMTYEAAIVRIADRIGWAEAAALCGVTNRAARNWADPESPVQIRLIDAEKLDRAFILAGGDHAPLARLMDHRLAAAHERATANLPSAIAAAADAARSCGGAVSSLITLTLGDITAEKRRQFKQDAEGALGALMTALAVLDQIEAEETRR